MPMGLNYVSNARFAVAGGFPIVLGFAAETMLDGVIPAEVASVSATLVAASASAPATVHLALFDTPATVGGDDGTEVARTSATVTTTAQTLTVSAPTDVSPTAYIVKLWTEDADVSVSAVTAA